MWKATWLLFSVSVWSAAQATPGEIRLEVGPNGLVRGVSLDGSPVLHGLHIAVPKPDWSAMIATSNNAQLRTQTVNGQHVTKGRMPAQGDPLFDFTSVRKEENGAHTFSYEITPRKDIEADTVLVRIGMNAADLAGKEIVVAGEAGVERNAFPPERKDPRIFFSKKGFDWMAWPVSDAQFLTLRPDWSTLANVHVQDNRHFGSDDFEIQIYAKVANPLKAGEPIRVAFELEATPAEEIAQAEETLMRERFPYLSSLTDARKPRIGIARPAASEVPLYTLLEIDADVAGTFENPFDPEDARLEGRFRTPSGAQETVRGFLAWDFERSREKGWEELRAAGPGRWIVRYTPREAGVHTYRLAFDDGSGAVETQAFEFTAIPSDDPGFIGVSEKNPLYFEYDDGAPYFAVGENVCWPGSLGTYDYDNYFKRLAENGANWARLWIGPFDCFTLERVAKGESDPAGLGRIDLASAWRVEYVMQLAERYGIKILFCIDSFNSLRINPDHAMWHANPYSAALGGPIEKPEEFFTNAQARKLFKRRLDYIVARWGHSRALFAWEFWNEVNIIEKYETEHSTTWHREMALYLRAIDPYGHMITTSWAGTTGDPNVDALPELDFIQSHQYGAVDPAAFMGRVCIEKAERYGKPHFFGEFGTGTRAEGTLEDVDGVHLHNGLWSGLMSNAAGTGMLWWWDNYVEPKDLYYHFAPIAKFVEGLPLNTAQFRQATVHDIELQSPPETPILETLDLQGDGASWDAAPFNEPNTFRVERNGEVQNIGRLPKLLHGKRNHLDLHNPPTFIVDYPADGEFIVAVGGVSGYGGANLKVFLDDKEILAKDFPDTDDSNNTLSKYAGPHAVPVPKGAHRIRVVNDGNDWVFVNYRLTNYMLRKNPGLAVFGMVDSEARADEVAAVLWFKNEKNTWYHHGLGDALRAIPPARVTLSAIPDGEYRVEWWDTYTGSTTDGGTIIAVDGRLVVLVPQVLRDRACKLVRASP